MYLLDTCALIWLVGDQDQFPAATRQALSEPTAEIFVSAISAFEIAIKVRKGKLELPLDPAGWYAEVLEFHGLLELPVTGRVAAASALLPPLHADPCDRIIIATALQGHLNVVTPDEHIRAYPGVRTSWG